MFNHSFILTASSGDRIFKSQLSVDAKTALPACVGSELRFDTNHTSKLTQTRETML